MHCPTPHSPARAGVAPAFLVDLVLAVSLAGCGGGDSGTTVATNAPAAASPPSSAQGPAAAPAPRAGAPSPSASPPPPAPSPAAGSIAAAYSIFVLDPSGGTGGAGINASGQMVWTSAPQRQFRAFFSDGTSVQPVAGGGTASASAVNASGLVTGSLLDAKGDARAFVWDSRTQAVTLMDTPPGTSSSGAGINGAGQVTGRRIDSMVPRVMRWTPGTQAIDTLESLGGAPATSVEIGLFINASGVVAGMSTTPDRSVRAALWAPGAPIRDLGTMGGINSAVTGLNDANQVIGQAELPAGVFRAFRWSQADGMQALGTLGGKLSFASGINAAGWIVGTSTDAAENSLGYLWRDGAMKSLGALGGPSSFANFINNAGLVAGTAATADGVGHAFVWSAADGMVDLNTRLATSSQLVLTTVVALADNGTMVVNSNGGLVLLRPVPAPWLARSPYSDRAMTSFMISLVPP